MIRFKNFSEAEAHDYFELIRMLYPQFVSGKDIEVINSPGKITFLSQGLNQVCHLPEGIDFQERRRRIKSYILNSLQIQERVSSKFGILTGVRPIKLIIGLLDKFSPDQLLNYLKDYYCIEDLMARFLISVALKEKSYFDSIDPKGYSVYIHIPFCPSRCDYCSYPIIKSSNKDKLQAYVDTLLSEIKSYRHLKNPPTSIYIGGGTPTSIGESQLERILKTSRQVFGQGMEFTVEAGRPDTLTGSIFSCLKEYGVTRISINPQTMQDKTLSRLNRRHSVEEFLKAFYEAKQLDFSINVDLILGLPGENSLEMMDSLNRVMALDPDNITAHTLSLKNGSRLFQEQEYYTNSEIISKLINHVYQSLGNKGYKPYYMYRQKRTLGNGFNAGYSKEGRESIYNMLMMDEQQSVLGFGMSSSSKFYYPESNRLEKVLQYKNLRDYQEHWQDKNSLKQAYMEDFKW